MADENESFTDKAKKALQLVQLAQVALDEVHKLRVSAAELLDISNDLLNKANALLNEGESDADTTGDAAPTPAAPES